MELYNTKPSVILNSGGLDSITLMKYCYHILGDRNIHSIHFTYGALNEQQQLRCVNKVCQELGAKNVVIELPRMPWTKSDFFKKGVESTSEGQYLEYRNLIFMSYAISYAESIGAPWVSLALVNGNEYVDTTPTFVDGLSLIASQSNIGIFTPFLEHNKAMVCRLAKTLGVKREDFFSCDRPTPDGRPCEVCDCCKEISQIFTETY